MKHLLSVSLLLMLSTLSSCTLSMSGEDFEYEAQRESRSSSFGRSASEAVLYKGSDEEFHYFKFSPQNGIPKSVKVPTNELILSDTFNFSDQKEDWIGYQFVK